MLLNGKKQCRLCELTCKREFNHEPEQNRNSNHPLRHNWILLLLSQLFDMLMIINNFVVIKSFGRMGDRNLHNFDLLVLDHPHHTNFIKVIRRLGFLGLLVTLVGIDS